MTLAGTVPVPSEYRPRTVEAGTSAERGRNEKGASGWDFDGTEPVETNRRKPKPAPAENECAACGHVHRHPEYPERKCFRPVPRAVGKLGVRVRLGRCRCRGNGDEIDGRRGPKDAACLDCGAAVPVHKGRRYRCPPCIERRDLAQRAKDLAKANAQNRAAFERRAPKCADCGGPVERRQGPQTRCSRCIATNPSPVFRARAPARDARRAAREKRRQAKLAAAPRCVECRTEPVVVGCLRCRACIDANPRKLMACGRKRRQA